MQNRVYTDPISGLDFEGLTDDWGNFIICSPFHGTIKAIYNETDGTITLPAWTFQHHPTMTLNEAVKTLGVSKVRVSRMCANGTLKSCKVRGSLVIDKASVDKIVRGKNDSNNVD